MIYRIRSKKKEYCLKATKNFLKLSFGRRVWYFERGKVWHSLVSIKDYGESTLVAHWALPWRITINRAVGQRLAHLGN